MKKSSLFALILIGYAMPQAGWAATGVAAAPFLNSPADARARALSGATGAVFNGAYDLFTNAAGLAEVTSGEASFSHQLGISQINTEAAAVAFPATRELGVGVGLIFRGQPDISNDVAGEDAIKANDMVLQVAGGTKVLSSLDAGAAIKVLRSTLGGFQANAVAVDLGARLHPLEGVTVGLAAANLGSGVKFIDESSPLPSQVTASGGWRGKVSAEHALGAAVDVNYGLAENTLLTEAGAEYTFNDLASLRLGYAFGQEQLGGLSAGAGVKLEIASLFYRLDYAFAPRASNGVSETEHIFTLSLAF